MEFKNLKSINEHIFRYPWETVIKSFWNKYPSPELKFVQFNNVINLEITKENCLKVKRLMYSKF